VEIYVIRHADAVALGEEGISDDAGRPLTPTGYAQTKRLADGFKKRGVVPSVIITSPLLRARQTAEGIAQQIPGPTPAVRVCEDLSPGGKRRKIARYLRELGSDVAVLVGHQPDLGELVGWLSGSKKIEIDMAKAGVALVACDENPGKGCGRLVSLVGPEYF
jgi:phosphohistidine phosphatase